MAAQPCPMAPTPVPSPTTEVKLADPPSVDVSAFQRLDLSGAELVSTQSTCSLQPTCVRLDMQDLDCFETVNHQYEQWGVTFNNAIAIQPSNPAFPPRTGQMVVMGAPKNGWIEAKFRQPVRFVSGFVTSSRRAVLAAFDANNQEIAKTEAPGPNLKNESSTHPPNIRLSLDGGEIHRVMFSAFDGNLTLDELNFSF